MLRNLGLAFVVVGAFACGGLRPYVPTVPESVVKRVEQRPLAPDPAIEPLPDGIPQGDWVEPLTKGDVAPKSGILSSEERAFRDAKYRIRYRAQRKNYEADRRVWAAARSERLRPSRRRFGAARPRIPGPDCPPRWHCRHRRASDGPRPMIRHPARRRCAPRCRPGGH